MRKQQLAAIMGVGTTLLWAAASFAGGGKVTYPDGRAVTGAEVNVHLQDIDKYKLTTDASGRFTLPSLEFEGAFVQIKAADGKEYATVNLPARVFESGDVSIVLQPKR